MKTFKEELIETRQRWIKTNRIAKNCVEEPAGSLFQLELKELELRAKRLKAVLAERQKNGNKR